VVCLLGTLQMCLFPLSMAAEYCCCCCGCLSRCQQHPWLLGLYEQPMSLFTAPLTSSTNAAGGMKRGATHHTRCCQGAHVWQLASVVQEHLLHREEVAWVAAGRPGDGAWSSAGRCR
jgi:hypothetical protein